MSKNVRAYIYAIIVSVGPIVSFYGLASQEEIALWLGLGGTVLGVPAGGLALKNLTPDEEPAQVVEYEPQHAA